ncbi:MAG TPA: DUF4331 family protein [Kofleriaceae bacterium]|nr:DUF4331 family protein [Kofleriaceae bacterium]
MKKLAFLGGAAGLGMIALLNTPITQAADHLDATALATNPMADINDVYAWNTSDGMKVNLAMTISPFDNGMRNFGQSVQYVFHLTRHAAFPQTAAQLAMGEESKIICTFTSNTAGECWVVDPMGTTLDYAKGDFSAVAGKDSAKGTFKVFAGRRSDPFFFNLAGFLRAQDALERKCGTTTTPGACPGNLTATLDLAKCPALVPPADVQMISVHIAEEQPVVVGPCAANQKDCFANANVMAIVIQIDKGQLATDEKKYLGVWASTHAGQ